MEERTLFITNMPASRIADYYISYMDGCVFIDFNNCSENLVCLKRIQYHLV
jgi:hypothetical protein